MIVMKSAQLVGTYHGFQGGQISITVLREGVLACAIIYKQLSLLALHWTRIKHFLFVKQFLCGCMQGGFY